MEMTPSRKLGFHDFDAPEMLISARDVLRSILVCHDSVRERNRVLVASPLQTPALGELAQRVQAADT